MTSSDARFTRINFFPFANNAYASISTIEDSGAGLTYPYGFGSNYAAAASGGGQYVQRGDMNIVGKIATQDQFYHKCGGLNTFDSSFCEHIGGYPNGAVLDYVVDNKIIQVISLVENNTVDFTTGGIDGVNWKQLNKDYGEISNVAFSCNIISSSGSYILGVFKASASGAFSVDSNIAITKGSTNSQSLPTGTTYMGWSDMSIAIKDCGSTYPSSSDIALPTHETLGTIAWNDWKNLIGGYNAYELYYSNSRWQGGPTYMTNVFPGFTKDNYYAIACLCGEYTTSWSSLTTTPYTLTLSLTEITPSGSFTIKYA